MMRRLRGIVAMAAGSLLLVASGILGLQPAGAEAALESNGWWYKPNQVPNNLVVPPAPPGSQSDGLFIAADPSGPFALAAVRYLAYGAGTLTLEFSPEGSSGIPSIAACVALTSWDGATAGRWEGKPIYDCTRQSDGVVSEDGSEMAFLLDPTMQRTPGTYDLVLAPVGPVPFTASFNAPRSEDLVTDGSGAPEEEGDFASAPDSSESFDYAPGGGFGSFETTFPVLDESRSGADAGLPAPQTPAPIAQPTVPAAAIPPLVIPDDKSQRLAAMAGLGLLLLGAWWFGGRAVRPPRLLGSVAGRAQVVDVATLEAEVAPERGIGRFSRPRV